MSPPDTILQVRITERTYCRWRKQYDGMGTVQLKELKKLQKEKEQLRRAVADLTLVKQILAEAVGGNCYAPHVADDALIWQWRSDAPARPLHRPVHRAVQRA